MKLINKISIWFIAIVAVLTPVCVSISYTTLLRKINNVEISRLMQENNDIAQTLRAGTFTEAATLGKAMKVSKLSVSLPEKHTEIINTASGEDIKTNKSGHTLTVNSYYKINGENYKVSSSNYTFNSNKIFWSMMYAMLWKLTCIVIAVIISARFISKYLFRAFRHSINEINDFSIKEKKRVRLQPTSIKEFRELNLFLEKMTNKAIDDYTSAKEFSENASHELQTPLAVLRSKIELLSETNISEDQAGLIESMQTAINKLSGINRSLVLLARLENQEYATNESIKFCRIVKNALAMYDDRVVLKNIQVHTDFEKNIFLNIHPDLAEILVTNLIGNAIRHNYEGGTINIVLTAQKFVISNTGKPLDITDKDLFQRFKKGNQSSNGVGLGLAIVKQICQVNGFTVSYEYVKGAHRFAICFETKSIGVSASHTLPAYSYPLPESIA